MPAVGVIREPLAVVLGVVAFACAAGAAWQSGLAWPAAAARPLARVAAAGAVVLAALGFSLGYWEVLSGVGDLMFRFDTPTTRFLFDIAAIGLPFAVAGLLLGVASTLHAADVPARAIVPAMVAGYAIGWLIDPFGTLAGDRMNAVRSRYAASLAPPVVPSHGVQPGASPVSRSLWDSYGGGWAWNPASDGGGGGGSSGGGGNGGGSGGGGGGGDAGEGAWILLLIALAVLAVAGGVITAALTFQAARKKAKAQLARVDAMVAARSY